MEPRYRGMRRLVVFFFLLLVKSGLHSISEQQEELKQAEVLFEASDFDRGQSLLSKEEPLTKEEWRRLFINYDLAFGRIRQGNRIEALSLLDDLLRQGGNFPPLAARVSYARAYILFLSLKNAALAKEGDPASFKMSRESLRFSSRVKDAYLNLIKDQCLLDKAKGGAECTPAEFFKEMRNQALNFRSEIAGKYYRMRTQVFTPIEALLQLLIGTEKIERHLKTILDSVSQHLLSLHLNYLAEEMQNFDAVFQKIELAGIEEIREQWSDFVNAMLQGDIKTSLERVSSVLQGIRELLRSQFNEEEAAGALYRLSESFQEVFLEEELIPNSLRSLAFLQEETFKIKKVQEVLPWKLRQFVSIHIQEAISLKESGNEEGSESEFLFADFMVKASLLFVLQNEKAPARAVLKLLISLVDNMVQQDTLYQYLKDDALKKWKEAVLLTIKTAMEKTELFDKAALREQKELFSQRENEDGSRGACVASPWERVIPPFDEGLEALDKSLRLTSREDRSFNQVGVLHAYVLEKWVEALEQMDDLSPAKGCGGAQGGGQEKGEDEAQSTGAEGIEETLRNIVQMGEDDKEFDEKKEFPKKESGKPW
ncbi:hypothetical protein [Estrella lausannensis]|uniref:Uncharacterized protein n=1 Tax=Estrella lausannensis TaxID=483423 RepID=A0A0H5DSX8_9BACT|nr:hypothetical protein [Estrella lausannensis]CRX38924.1 hypothetical protein ELAC_1596 [Estrella lausannensis]